MQTNRSMATDLFIKVFLEPSTEKHNIAFQRKTIKSAIESLCSALRESSLLRNTSCASLIDVLEISSMSYCCRMDTAAGSGSSSSESEILSSCNEKILLCITQQHSIFMWSICTRPLISVTQTSF